MTISIDFNNKTERFIKPVHGVNNSPISLYDLPTGFKEAGIPFTRLHDTSFAYGGSVYVDIPNIFPDFNADENDPSSYSFEFTDAYFKNLTATGTKIFYRLGVTIENNYRIKAFHIAPPADFAKWARICEHIIRHYNEGWADGFHYNIEYWEIWNEPENPPMWSGSKEQFFELYKTAAIHLKKCFPDIKFGGYASCGFYAVTQKECSDFYKSFITWAEDFCKFVNHEKLPLNFFSWHRYFNDPDVLIAEAEYARNMLDRNNLQHTESIFNEWNYCNGKGSRSWDDMKSVEGASKIAHTFILLQNLPVDKAMYYDATPTRSYCGLYYFPSQTVTPAYYSFMAFNSLYKLKNEVSSSSSDKKIRVLAAANGNSAAALITNSSAKSINVSFDIKNAPGTANVKIIDKRHTFKDISFANDFKMPPYSVLLLEFNSQNSEKISQQQNRTNFAGLDNSAKNENHS